MSNSSVFRLRLKVLRSSAADRQLYVSEFNTEGVLTFFFFLRMRLRPRVGQPGSSSIISRVKLGQTTVQLRKRAGFDDVGHRLGITTGAQISVCKTPCLSTGTAMPLA